jgi:hypothetical protein
MTSQYEFLNFLTIQPIDYSVFLLQKSSIDNECIIFKK